MAFHFDFGDDVLGAMDDTVAPTMPANETIGSANPTDVGVGFQSKQSAPSFAFFGEWGVSQPPQNDAPLSFPAAGNAVLAISTETACDEALPSAPAAPQHHDASRMPPPSPIFKTTMLPPPETHAGEERIVADGRNDAFGAAAEKVNGLTSFDEDDNVPNHSSAVQITKPNQSMDGGNDHCDGNGNDDDNAQSPRRESHASDDQSLRNHTVQQVQLTHSVVPPVVADHDTTPPRNKQSAEDKAEPTVSPMSTETPAHAGPPAPPPSRTVAEDSAAATKGAGSPSFPEAYTPQHSENLKIVAFSETRNTQSVADHKNLIFPAANGDSATRQSPQSLKTKSDEKKASHHGGSNSKSADNGVSQRAAEVLAQVDRILGEEGSDGHHTTAMPQKSNDAQFTSRMSMIGHSASKQVDRLDQLSSDHAVKQLAMLSMVGPIGKSVAMTPCVASVLEKLPADLQGAPLIYLVPQLIQMLEETLADLQVSSEQHTDMTRSILC